MAYDVNKLARLSHLKSMAEAAKTDYTAKIGVIDKKIDDQIKATNAVVAKAFKSGKVDGNTVNLYTSDNMTGDAAFSFDFPIEMVLDQAKTAFVPKFAFSEETYTGATNPKLEGKPVMVLAVKGTDNSVTYSFLNMATLVDTYTAKAGDGSATVTVEGYEITVNVEVSEKEGNLLQKDENGKLFVSVDQTGKADKVTGATEGNLAALDNNGNLTDSGIAKDNVVVDDDIKDVVRTGNVATDAEVTEMLKEVFPTE